PHVQRLTEKAAIFSRRAPLGSFVQEFLPNFVIAEMLLRISESNLLFYLLLLFVSLRLPHVEQSTLPVKVINFLEERVCGQCILFPLRVKLIGRPIGLLDETRE